ncbi:MAG: mercuric reductase [Thermoanaerobaculia bacterium]
MSDAPLVLPLDGHNQRLVDNLHPASWTQPEPAPVYHLVVLGGGAAGLSAAMRAAALGARVAVVERHLLGGCSLNSGCIPSKALLRAARVVSAARHAADFGGRGTAEASDFGAAMDRVRRVRAEVSAARSAWRLRDLGIDVFLGEGRFTGSDALSVADRTLRFRRALVATGTRPSAPDLEGLADIGYLTSDNVFSLTDLPRRLAIVGGGPLGCELAQSFARFGSQVTLFLRDHHLLPAEDEACAAIIHRALEADGVRIVTGARLIAVRRPQRSKVLHFELDGHQHQLPADELLVATGRSANVQGLGLENASVAFSPRGIEVDDQLRTANPRIFACGDVASNLRQTHLSEAQAKIVVENALFGGRRRVSDLVVPRCTFTHPELAQVGASEAELTARGVRFRTLEVALDEDDRVRVDGAPPGRMKLIYRQGSDRLLGATIVADHAGETIGELVVAIQNGIGLARLAATIHAYPTHSTALTRAAEAWENAQAGKWRQRYLSFYFRRQEKAERRRIASARSAEPPLRDYGAGGADAGESGAPAPPS